MKTIRKILLGVSAAMMTTTAAIAADFGAMPVNYQSALEDYVSSRLIEPRGARYRVIGEPYQVYADFDRHSAVPAWAVDVKVRTRLPNGDMGASQTYTVIFVDGVPVALEEDISNVKPI